MAKSAKKKTVEIDIALLAADYVDCCKRHAETLKRSQMELSVLEACYTALFMEAVRQGKRTIPFSYDGGNGDTISGTLSFRNSPGTLEWRRDDADMVAWVEKHLDGTDLEECLIRKDPVLNQKVICSKLMITPEKFKGSGFYIDTDTQRVLIKTDDGVSVKTYATFDAEEQAEVVSRVGEAAFKNFRKGV